LPRKVAGERRHADTFDAAYCESGLNVEEKPGISVIVPVYNSEESLRELVDGISGQFELVGSEFEVILVDDRSRDGSWAVLRELAEQYPQVVIARLGRNYGQHNALLAGLSLARHDIVVTMDDDLQHPPTEIPRLLDALVPSVDVVYGVADVEEHGFMRSLASRLTKFVFRVTLRWEHAESVSAFRAFRRSVLATSRQDVDPFLSLDVLLSWYTDRVVVVPVEMQQRKYGRSQYTLRRLVKHAVNNLTGFSTLPLRFVSFLGVMSAFLGLLLLAFVLGRYIVNRTDVPGFTFLASTLAIFGGAQLLAIGVLGEYLGRMHFRTMGRPVYAIRDVKSSRDRTEAPVP
jgi:undecaprenyl-phosphate 4-deoxy-4-formamido-L-arabinose transferase